MGSKDIHDMKHPLTGQSMLVCYKNTLAREKYLADQGYKVKSIWEHEYENLLRENCEMR